MKYITAFVVFFSTSIFCFSQRVIVPLEYNPEQAEHYQKNSRLRLMAAGDTLLLPFWDDFTQSHVSPAPLKWEPSGGVYINNTYGVNPPNFNVATFDGLRGNGTPYSTVNITQKGPADSLTSRPIDLSGLVPGDSLYLRFYWQRKGNGETPDLLRDSLRLQFKTVTGSWSTVWKETGGDSSPFFHQVVRVGDAAKYYYKGFQFRYQSFGRLSGSYDVWNLDYIYMDTSRQAKANWAPDLSFATTPSSFLKNYTAMPIGQYLANPTAETADKIKVDLTMISNVERTYKLNLGLSKLTDITTNQVIQNFPDIRSPIEPLEIVTPQSRYWRAGHEISVTPDPSLLTPRPKVLKYTFVMNDSLDAPVGQKYSFAGADSAIARIDYRANDSISGYTYLTDYYAYDDGTAEAGFGVNQDLGKLAVRYTLNSLPDTITHIDIYFPKIGTDKSSEPLVLTIWSSLTPGTSDETILYREAVGLQHSTALNKFHRYKLENPVRITTPVFYIGYQQSTNEALYVGLDRNNHRMSNVYYAINGFWFQEDEQQGSLMMRPVLEDASILGVKDRNYRELECEVFPNPSSGTISIAGKIASMSLYDLSGKLLLTRDYDGRIEEIRHEDLSGLPAGMYILHLQNEDAKAVRKIVLND